MNAGLEQSTEESDCNKERDENGETAEELCSPGTGVVPERARDECAPDVYRRYRGRKQHPDLNDLRQVEDRARR